MLATVCLAQIDQPVFKNPKYPIVDLILRPQQVKRSSASYQTFTSYCIIVVHPFHNLTQGLPDDKARIHIAY
jgi:hypothetical protein